MTKKQKLGFEMMRFLNNQELRSGSVFAFSEFPGEVLRLERRNAKWFATWESVLDGDEIIHG